jgi:hypothetical protein
VPAQDEWSLREVITHMLGAEYGFLGVVQYTVAPDRATARKRTSAGVRGASTATRAPLTLDGGVAEVRNAIFEIHQRVLRELGSLSDALLERNAMFWDGEKPIRFRLNRFEAHLIQHTVQVDKALVWIGRAPTEAQRLVRVLYRDLAAVEMLSSAEFGKTERDEVAKTISERAAEIG